MSSSKASSSDEATRLAALNRLKLKTSLREKRKRSPSPTAGPGGSKKNVRNATKGLDEEEKKGLERDRMLGKYFDYDLSKMKNSKGGFLLEEDDEGLSEAQRIEKIRKAERAKARGEGGWEPDINPLSSPSCCLCTSIEVDHKFKEIFGVLVCNRHKKENPDRFSLLTKTECREDYLLTNDELSDEELLPHMLAKNPHGGTFSNMMLFLREQVEKVAFEKWGSAEALDQEYARREGAKRLARDKKFKLGLKELRRRTTQNLLAKRAESEHHHKLEVMEDEGVKRCECGFEIEIEVM